VDVDVLAGADGNSRDANRVPELPNAVAGVEVHESDLVPGWHCRGGAKRLGATESDVAYFERPHDNAHIVDVFIQDEEWRPLRRCGLRLDQPGGSTVIPRLRRTPHRQSERTTVDRRSKNAIIDFHYLRTDSCPVPRLDRQRHPLSGWVRVDNRDAAALLSRCHRSSVTDLDGRPLTSYENNPNGEALAGQVKRYGRGVLHSTLRTSRHVNPSQRRALERRSRTLRVRLHATERSWL
jgi:hypothetical protein